MRASVKNQPKMASTNRQEIDTDKVSNNDAQKLTAWSQKGAKTRQDPPKWRPGANVAILYAGAHTRRPDKLAPSYCRSVTMSFRRDVAPSL